VKKDKPEAPPTKKTRGRPKKKKPPAVEQTEAAAAAEAEQEAASETLAPPPQAARQRAGARSRERAAEDGSANGHADWLCCNTRCNKATLMTSDEVVQANANFLQLSASIEEVRASQAAATAKKPQDKAAAQRDKSVTPAEAKAAATAAVNTLLAKHGVDTVDNLQHANLERLTARRGPQVVPRSTSRATSSRWANAGKAAKGNVAAKLCKILQLSEDDDDKHTCVILVTTR
jgi:hypothetical protein